MFVYLVSPIPERKVSTSFILDDNADLFTSELEFSPNVGSIIITPGHFNDSIVDFTLSFFTYAVAVEGTFLNNELLTVIDGSLIELAYIYNCSNPVQLLNPYESNFRSSPVYSITAHFNVTVSLQIYLGIALYPFGIISFSIENV